MEHASPIRDYMTRIPHAVDVGQAVADALARMSTLAVGHLPVVESGRLVGMLSARELAQVSEVVGFDAQAVPVGDVMRADVWSVPPQAALCDVVGEMALRRTDCCAVVEEGRVVGILTSTDALLLLAQLLGGPPQLRMPLRPSQVRARILAEHTLLRCLCVDLERLAARVTDEIEDEEAERLLRERCRELQLTLLGHIELENALLAPALREVDGFGPERAQQLLAEHALQTASARALLDAVDNLAIQELAAQVERLVAHLRADMVHEERAMLNPDLLRDDVIDVAASS